MCKYFAAKGSYARDNNVFVILIWQTVLRPTPKVKLPCVASLCCAIFTYFLDQWALVCQAWARSVAHSPQATRNECGRVESLIIIAHLASENFGSVVLSFSERRLSRLWSTNRMGKLKQKASKTAEGGSDAMHHAGTHRLAVLVSLNWSDRYRRLQNDLLALSPRLNGWNRFDIKLVTHEIVCVGRNNNVVTLWASHILWKFTSNTRRVKILEQCSWHKETQLHK